MVVQAVFNTAVATNAMIDYARERANKLLILAEKDDSGVTPPSIGKLEDALDALKEADAELADFAKMNGFSLS